MAPHRQGGDIDSQVSKVLADADLNNSRAEGAPQQAVVSGWAARDLLAIIARNQSSQSTNDDRVAALLAVLVAGVGFVLISGIGTGRSGDPAAIGAVSAASMPMPEPVE
jgi:hypothetical protein